MSPVVRAAFEPDIRVILLDRILPTRQVTDAIRAGPRYRSIAASIAEVGVIEPPVVYPQPEPGTYLLLDGHLRVAILRARGESEARCLVATDDEGYTYNHKINRLAPIQEYRMVMRALEAGVPEERIARALDLTVEAVRRRRTLLRGVCEEALTLLKDKPVGTAALRSLRRVLPARQVEIAELMVAASNYTGSYAQALVTRTRPEEQTEEERAARAARDPATDLARVEREVLAVEREVVALRNTYGTQFLHLALACGYVRSLLDNPKVEALLARRHGEILAALKKLASATSLDP